MTKFDIAIRESETMWREIKKHLRTGMKFEAAVKKALDDLEKKDEP